MSGRAPDKGGRKRLYLIGIDSAAAWIIKELSRDHRMKGFDLFSERGAFSDLESTLPPITAAAWPTIYTGKNPEMHGVTNFFSIGKSYERQILYYDMGRSPPFWNALAEEGLKCLIITPAMVVGTDEKKNVDMITGFPLRPKFSSSELEALARKMGFDGEPEIEGQLAEGKVSIKEASRAYVESIRSRSEMCKRLIKEGDYDFVFVCFTETDRIQHYTLAMDDWKSYIGPVYEAISDFIEWISDNCAKDENSAIMMVSDHGAQPIKAKFLLNSWLVKKGFAKLKQEGDSDHMSEDLGSISLNRRDGVPGGKKGASGGTVEKHGVRFICASVADTDGGVPNKVKLDMENTLAFAYLSNNPVSNIWINNHRFSKPGVKESESGSVAKRLIRELEEIKTEDGKRLVKRIVEGKDYYKGKSQLIMPDMLVEVAEGYTIDVSNYVDGVVLAKPEAARSGDHTRNGVIGFYSKSSGIDTDRISLLNIAPSIMGYYGLKGAQFQENSRLKVK